MIPNIDFAVSDYFKVPYLESAFGLVKPRQANDLMLRDKFFPMKTVSDADMVTLHSHGYGGKTSAIAKSATDLPTFSLPTNFVKDHEFGYWGEGIKFDKETIQKANAATVPALATEAIVARALEMMSYHNDMLFEWTASQVAWTGSYAINAGGVVYTYSDGVPAHYRLDMTDGGFSAKYWSPVTWDNLTTSTPLSDLREMVRYAADRLGLNIVEMIMSSTVAKLIEDSTEVKTWVKQNPALSASAITAAFVIKELMKIKDISVTIDDRVHLEYANVTVSAASNATVITVDDISNLVANRYVLVKQGKNEAMCKVASTATSGLTKTVTVTVAAGFALTAGQAVIEIPVAYSPSNTILFRTEKANCSSWVILPDNIRAEDPMEAKIHLWSKFKNKEPYYFRTLGNYFKGGIINREPGNYLTLKVQA